MFSLIILNQWNTPHGQIIIYSNSVFGQSLKYIMALNRSCIFQLPDTNQQRVITTPVGSLSRRTANQLLANNQLQSDSLFARQLKQSMHPGE